MLYDGFTIPELSRRSYFHHGTHHEHSVCYMMVPPSLNWPEAFISNFTNETAYYSLWAVSSSQSSFTPFSIPAGHSMNTLYAIRHFHHPQIVLKKLFPVSKMRLNITGCRLFFAPASLFTPFPR